MVVTGICKDVPMRTTLTLDDDLADRLKRLAAEEGITFKEAVDRSLRAGLEARTEARPYQTRARPLDLRADIDVTKALQVAAALEDEEVVREVLAGR
jgi:hypothetical protein